MTELDGYSLSEDFPVMNMKDKATFSRDAGSDKLMYLGDVNNIFTRGAIQALLRDYIKTQSQLDPKHMAAAPDSD